ncbi:MAG: glycosyltransferase family 87 protein [Gaiellaceae bacterium]
MRAAATRILWLVLCGFLPLVALWYAIAPVAFGDRQAADFHFNYYYAAEAIRAGEDFYPTDGFVVRGANDLIIDYVYPPLLAIATVPWTVVPIGVAEVLFQLVLVAAFVATFAVLGVRDWRCYGLAFLWPPVTDAVTTGNVTILLGLGAALTWRYRDRPLVAGASVGISVATKIFLWPLTMWLAATRRTRAAAWSVVIAAVALFASWAAVGFRGLADYPDLARRLSDRMDERGYTVYALGVDLGLSHGVAKALWVALAVALLGATVALARRGEERHAFVLALAAAIAFSPIEWLHYFALLLVAVAVVQPRLAPIWFVGLPLQLVVTTGVYNGSTLQTAAVLGAAALTVALALRRPEREARPVALSSPAAARS